MICRAPIYEVTMVAATVRTEQPAPEHIITPSHSSSVLCLLIHPSFLSVFVFLLLSSPHFFFLSIFFPFFPTSVSPFVFLPAVLLSPAVKESVCVDRRFSCCPVIGRCVILGAVNNSCCCVEGRATQWEVLIGAQQEGGWMAGWVGVGCGGHPLARWVLTVSLPSNPLHPWQS